MTDVNSTYSAGSVLSDYSISKTQQDETKNNELGQSAFLELMITQLNNQDPLNPQENGEFISQLAQFSSVEGLERLNESFDGFSANFLSNQALQASSLVGRSVTVPTDTAILDSGGLVSGVFELPSRTSNASISVYSQAGALLQEIDLGAQSAGEKVFRWDGLHLELDGEMVDWVGDVGEDEMPAALGPGSYTVKVNALIDGEATQMDTALSANVNSVTVGTDGGLILNLAGLGAVGLGDVKLFN